jgi:hypothetical protein
MQVMAEVLGSASSRLLFVRFQIRTLKGLFCDFIVASCVCFSDSLVCFEAALRSYMHASVLGLESRPGSAACLILRLSLRPIVCPRVVLFRAAISGIFL